MKKHVLPLVIVLVASCAAAFLLLKHKAARRVETAQLVPGDTLFFAELQDCPRTALRWQQTALFQLWQEPEVQAFLEKPRSKVPTIGDWQSKLDAFVRIKPLQAFVAVTTLEGDSPRWIAGFSYAGSQSEVERSLAAPREELRKAWPAGKADIGYYGSTEIQTYTDKSNTVAEAFQDNWYFVSNQLDILHGTLDRYNGKPSGSKPALAADETYRKSLAPLPADADLRAFARVGVLTDRVASLMAAAGQKADPQQLSDLKKTQAIALSSKLDGSQFRDTIFSYAPGTGKQPPLSRHGLALSTGSTLLYYGATLPASLGVPQSNEPGIAQLLPMLADVEKALADNGLKLSDATSAFGPEMSSLFDWTPATLAPPSFLLAVDVRDAAKAKAFIQAITSVPNGASGWTHIEQDGATIFQPPAPAGGLAGFTLPSPSIGLSDRFLVLGLSTDAVTSGLAQLKNKAGKLNDQPAFQAAEKTVEVPTASFGYVDLRSLVERSYGIMRPFLAMSLAFNANSGQYLDAGKLPDTETLTKHLGPSVLSQATTDDGTLMESTGPLTFDQIVVMALGGAGVAAFPMIEQTMQNGGGLLPPSLLPTAPAQSPLPASPAPGSSAAPANPAAPAAPAPAIAPPAAPAQEESPAPARPAAPASVAPATTGAPAAPAA